MKPTISIITVTLNGRDVLAGLIDSLRAQTDRDFEWVVVDGASTDGTIELINAAGDVVSKWISEPDFGIYHAMNKAIQMMSGEYYLVMGADDRLQPNAIAQYKQHALLSDADFVTAWIIRDGRLDAGKPRWSWLYAMFAYITNHSVGTLIRRSLHDRFGFYSKRFPVGADMYFVKSACMSPSTSIHQADFVAGEHGSKGVSGLDKAASFCDTFRVQLETERWKMLQIILFVAKLIWRAGDLIRLSHTRSVK